METLFELESMFQLQIQEKSGKNGPENSLTALPVEPCRMSHTPEEPILRLTENFTIVL